MSTKLVVPLSVSELPDLPGSLDAALYAVLGREGRTGPVRAVLELRGPREAADPVLADLPVAGGDGVPQPAWFTERVIVDGSTSGLRAKLWYWISRRASMDLAGFDAYWAREHAKVARRIPELRRYVQSLRLDRRGSHDGIAELWWADVSTQQAAMRSPQTAAAMEDEKAFIDHGHVLALVAEPLDR